MSEQFNLELEMNRAEYAAKMDNLRLWTRWHTKDPNPFSKDKSEKANAEFLAYLKEETRKKEAIQKAHSNAVWKKIEEERNANKS